MKKIIIPVVIALAIAGLVALSRFHPEIVAKVGTSQLGSSGNTKNYKDGKYTGQTVDVGYGPVQVEAIIRGGRITRINFLQMPNDRPRSIEVTNMAEPILRSETLTAQDADIDIASGATQTSEGYIQSLQDALAQAKS